ncbi:MAG: ribonuclease Y [Erysipelotrichaceae bacterium]|nr:ribonuclease Y [Erysipelotrichaceae bacterium]
MVVCLSTIFADPLFWLFFVVGLIIGAVVGALVVYKLIPNNAKKQSDEIIKVAELKGSQIIKSAQIEGRSVALELKIAFEKEAKEKKDQILELEKTLVTREQQLDIKESLYAQKEEQIKQANQQLESKNKDLEKKQLVLQEKIDSIIVELQNVAQMSIEDAKKELFRRVEEKIEHEITAFMKEKQEEAEEKAEEAAKEILGLAVDKYSQEVASERTVSVVALPSDEMKGRIIGREGRNIKTIEQLTGVDLIIDDTPEVITVSCFDPIRREIARRSLEALIKDGRIQPGRIEEIIERSKQEVKEITRKAGEEALFKLNLPKMNKELVEIIGRLKFRTSYGQNALTHSMEVAHLCGIMAAELGVDQQLAKRAGLLHDLGKALDFEMEGSHVELGVRYAKKFNENDVVINSIESHHGDVPAKYIISHLVSAADTLSAARPGARSETLETYIKRIEQLETISKGFDGVSTAYAIQAGREVRVLVVPEKIDDIQAYKIAREIKNKIETELTYPGQIKVTVVRETRACEVAK